MSEIKIIRDIAIGEKPSPKGLEGDGIKEYDFFARAGTIIGKDDETGAIFTEVKEKRKKQLAPINDPAIAQQVWLKAQEQLPEIIELERINEIKKGLSDMIISNCKKGMHYAMAKQLEFMKSNPNTILPTELNHEETVKVFEEAIEKYDNRIEKRRVKLEKEKAAEKATQEVEEEEEQNQEQA